MRYFSLALCAFLSLMAFPAEGKDEGLPAEIPAPGQVTMVDLGAKSCIPCKMMAPILTELEKEYAGRAVIAFIDVRERPEQAEKYHLRAIPTQIFYERDGREQWRHEGFLDKESIVARLKGLGVDGGQ